MLVLVTSANPPVEIPDVPISPSPGSFYAVLLLLVFLAVACSSPPPVGDFSGGDPERGKRLVALAGGCGCHTESAGPALAGGKELVVSLGKFYSPNITSDREHGIGAWTDLEVEGAIRRGVRRDGAVENPAMPYYRYAGMSDGDVADMIAWLRTVPPSDRPNQPDDTWLPFPALAMRAWRTLFVDPLEPWTQEAVAADRGRYLTDHIAICGDCHTPRNLFQAPRHSLYLAGSSLGSAPNITPDKDTGIGDWDEEDILSCLELGMLPNMDSVQGLMEEVVDGVAGGLGYFTAPEEDLRSIATYIRHVPPIHHVVE